MAERFVFGNCYIYFSWASSFFLLFIIRNVRKCVRWQTHNQEAFYRKKGAEKKKWLKLNRRRCFVRETKTGFFFRFSNSSWLWLIAGELTQKPVRTLLVHENILRIPHWHIIINKTVWRRVSNVDKLGETLLPNTSSYPTDAKETARRRNNNEALSATF